MKKSAGDIVYNFILEQISSGIWHPGTRISTETQLQQSLGVSKTTVRGAVEKLVAMGVLTKRQGDGTYVNSFTPDTLFQPLIPFFLMNAFDAVALLEFREVMEPACVQMFIRNENQNSTQKLSSLLEQMASAVEQKKADLFSKADRDFHFEIALGCGNPVMLKIYEILSGALASYHESAEQTIGAKTGVEEHRAILKAILDQDEELASLLMKRHIQRSKKDIQIYMQEHPREDEP